MSWPVVDARRAPLALVVLALTGCEADLERVRVYFPFDAGALDETEILCAAIVEIDLNEDGIDDLTRTYTFAADGTLRTLIEEAGGANPFALQDDPPEIGAPRETVFLVDPRAPHRVVSLTRLDVGGGAAVSARAGFVDGRLRSARYGGRTTTLGPRVNTTWTSGTLAVTRGWATDETGAWRTFRAEERATDSGSGSPVVAIREDTLELSGSDTSLVGTLTRTTTVVDTTYVSGLYTVALVVDDDGVPASMTTMDQFNGTSQTATYEVNRAPDRVSIDVVYGDGVGARTGIAERGPRGHVYRVQRAGSLVVCRVAITDPLGFPLWLAADPNECAALLDEEIDEQGFARTVTTGVRRVAMSFTTTCDDACVLAPAPPIDDGSALALLDRWAMLSPAPVLFESGQDALVEHVPACEVAR